MNKGTNNGSINSSRMGTYKSTNKGANIRKKEDLSNSIVKELKASDKPLSTSDLTFKLDKAWHTIDRACLMLQIEQKIEGFKVGKMDLWRMK